MTYIEASATGTPVVGCSVGGVPYAIKHGETGLLAEPNSVDSLYSALLGSLRTMNWPVDSVKRAQSGRRESSPGR